MKLQEGPAFGALIIGTGVAFLVWQKTAKPGMAIGAGLLVAIADYILVIAIKKLFKK